MTIERPTMQGIFLCIILATAMLLYALFGDPPYAYFGVMRWFVAGTNLVLGWLLLNRTKLLVPLTLLHTIAAGLFIFSAMRRSDWEIFNWCQIWLFAVSAISYFISPFLLREKLSVDVPSQGIPKTNSRNVIWAVLVTIVLLCTIGLMIYNFGVRPHFELQISIGVAEAQRLRQERDSIEQQLAIAKSESSSERRLREALEGQIAELRNNRTETTSDPLGIRDASSELPIGRPPQTFAVGDRAWLVIVESSANVGSVRELKESLRVRFGAESFVATSQIWSSLSNDVYAVVLNAYRDPSSAESAVQFIRVRGFSDAYSKSVTKLK